MTRNPSKKRVAQPNAFYCKNAFFNSVNQVMGFSVHSPQCVNAAFAPILWHEMGHWLNQRYGGLVGQSAFNEGLADTFAMYQMDDSELPESSAPAQPGTGGGSGGTSVPARSGLNLEAYCGDCVSEFCVYPEVHLAGLPLMGALWKVRANLEAQHGVQLGGDTADALFLGWMNAFNQSEIHTIIKYQWLVLDDDNADLDDLTPNFASIEAAFLANGFPAHDPVVYPLICR